MDIEKILNGIEKQLLHYQRRGWGDAIERIETPLGIEQRINQEWWAKNALINELSHIVRLYASKFKTRNYELLHLTGKAQPLRGRKSGTTERAGGSGDGMATGAENTGSASKKGSAGSNAKGSTKRAKKST